MAKEYIFRVTPRERGDRCRVIRIGGRRTLDELHGEILKAYGLTANHLYMFSPDGEPYDRNGYYSPYDEEAEKHADEAVLDDLKLKKGDKWLYLYDFGEDRMFDVAVDGVEQEEPDLFAGGAGVRVDLLSGDDRMESILAGCGQEELQVIREILEIGEEKKPAERKAEKQLRKREAGEIVRMLRQRPELLERLVSAKGILLLMRMRKNRNISVRECVAEQKDLSVMNALGLTFAEERRDDVLYLTQDAARLADHFQEAERRERLEKSAEREVLLLSILQFYQVMEADRLYEMFCTLYGEECSRKEFDNMAFVLEFGWSLSGVLDEEENLCVTSRDPVGGQRILAVRELYPVPDYCPKSRSELESCYRDGIHPSAMPALMEYLIMEKGMLVQDCRQLEELLKEGADLALSLTDIEDAVREVLKNYGMRLTKRLREMMSGVMEEYPSAALKGYSMREYRKLS